jgi:hypothetical protein
MATSLIPNYYKYNAAENFVDSFSQTGVNGNFYYVFAGNHLPYTNTIPTIYDNVSNTAIDVYRNMIFGKQVQSTDVSLMIRRIDYESNKPYEMYDDQDRALGDKDFFAVVNEGGFYNIFKCLNNNNGANSTVTPSITSVGTDGIFYSPVDGYTWKYMYSVNNTTFDKFSNDKYIPYTANTQVIDNAIDGSIDSVKVTVTGSGYSNYIQDASFISSDVHLYSNTQYYGISGAVGASSTDDFYRGCYFGITSGTGSGQYREIIAYEGTANTKYVVLTDPFVTDPDNTSTYSIYPGVYIYGDQTETVNAIAWAYVNTSGNTISRVEMIEPGAGYKIAVANVYAHPSVGITSAAAVRPILSPPGGHGSNPGNELYSSRAAVSVKFTTTESNTVPSTNQFRQIGLLLNPVYTSAAINFSSSTSSFVAGETAYSFYPKRIQNHVDMSVGSISANVEYGGILDTALNTNDKVFISDGTQTQLFTVSTVVNSSVVEFTSSSLYDFANAQMYTLDTQAYGEVIVTSAGSITLSNIRGHIKDDASVVGDISGAYTDSITSIEISDTAKQFDTFVATYRYTGTVLSGTFVENETLTQVTNNTSNGVLHSVQTLGGITSFFVTNQNGIFNTSNTITGSNSGAVASLTDKYSPEIVFNSGRILYLENLDPITRANTQSETFKLIFEF